MDDLGLTDADVAAFQRDGYHVHPQLLGDAEVATLREHCMAVLRGDYETRRPPMSCNPSAEGDPTAPHPGLVCAAPLHQVNNAYWSDATVARHVTDERIGRLAATLAGVAGVRLWHDQLLMKPQKSAINEAAAAETNGTEDGSVTFHQDYGYWQCISDQRALTARIALYDEDEANGCMYVLPGSHAWEEVFVAGRNVFQPPNPPVEEQFAQISQLAGGRSVDPHPLRVKAVSNTSQSAALFPLFL